LSLVLNTSKPYTTPERPKGIDEKKIRNIINTTSSGYISPEEIQQILDAVGIPRAGEAVVKTREEAIQAASKLRYPVVMKVVGPVHKSDVGGVALNVKDEIHVITEFDRMIKIKDTTAILIQPMLSGIELFVGAKKDDNFGHMVLCGIGGIFVEILKDISAGLVPICKNESGEMIKSLKSYNIIKGARGQEGVDEKKFTEIIVKVSALLKIAPEIIEMDINPLLGRQDSVVAVDARIRVEV